jgi:thiol-disulfide isomerase/thioredoxin
MSQMVFFASAVRDTTRERYWQERAVHENPTDLATVQQRVFMVYDQQHSPETRLEAFERLWREAGGQSIQLGYDAFNLALRSGDATLVQRWGDRILASHPEAKALVGINYADIPVLRARGMDLIRAALRHLTDSTDDRRPLEDDAARYRIAAARGGQGLLLALGKALLREGQSRAALDTLDKAIGLGWNVGVFRATAEAELAVGDSSMAARWLAFAAADPTSAPSAADSTRARLGARIGSARWTAWVDTASRELRQEILAAGERVRAVTDLGLVDTVGLEASIGKLAQDRPSVIAFVSRECPPSLAQLASLQIAANKLRNAGVPLLTIVREVPNAVVVRAFRSRGFALPLYFDTRGRASRALGQVGTPHYFVFDPLGGVRFESRSPDEILRQVAAIQGRPLPRIDAIRLPVTARPAAAR